MSKRKSFAGTTSNSLPVFIYDTSSTTGGGLSGVTFASGGLVMEYRRYGQATWTAVTPVTKTLGTYVSGGIVADGALAGAYEVDFPDAAFAAGVRSVMLRVRGVTNMFCPPIEIELDAVNYQDAAGFGLSRLDTTIGSRMGAYTQPTGFLATTFPAVVAGSTQLPAAPLTATQVLSVDSTTTKYTTVRPSTGVAVAISGQRISVLADVLAATQTGAAGVTLNGDYHEVVSSIIQSTLSDAITIAGSSINNNIVADLITAAAGNAAIKMNCSGGFVALRVNQVYAGYLVDFATASFPGHLAVEANFVNVVVGLVKPNVSGQLTLRANHIVGPVGGSLAVTTMRIIGATIFNDIALSAGTLELIDCIVLGNVAQSGTGTIRYNSRTVIKGTITGTLNAIGDDTQLGITAVKNLAAAGI
jgi:hypothetical protein